MNAANVHGVGLADTYASSLPPPIVPLLRVCSMTVGLGLAALGWRRGGPLGALGALVGGALFYQGVAGRWPRPAVTVGALAPPSRAMEPGASASVALDRGVGVDDRVVIERPAAEVYAFFRDLHNLPKVLSHVERVEVSSSGLSHWTVRGPAGVTFEWDAEVITDHPDERIAWRSREGSEVRSAGSVHFIPLAGERTEVHVRLRYEPPGGALGEVIAHLLGAAPADQLREDLGRLKAVLEQGSTAP